MPKTITLQLSPKQAADEKYIDAAELKSVTDAYDTYGEGWKTLPEKHELQPE